MGDVTGLTPRPSASSAPSAFALQGDALDVLRGMESGSVHCAVTSPPYWGLRRYQAGELEMGSEATSQDHIERLVAVFHELKRVLRDDGTLWLNYGDTYGRGAHSGAGSAKQMSNKGAWDNRDTHEFGDGSLHGLPERLVLALQADGWVWRSTVVFAKPAPMPESVQGWRWEQHRVKITPRSWTDDGTHVGDGHSGDVRHTSTQAAWAPCPGCSACAPNDGLVLRRGSWRPTRAWEPIFMLAKRPGYYGDGEMVRDPVSPNWKLGRAPTMPQRGAHVPTEGYRGHQSHPQYAEAKGANARNVWIIPPEPCNWDFCLACDTLFQGQLRRAIEKHGATRVCPCGATDAWVDHYAAFPSGLPRRCIAASTSERGVCAACGASWARVIDKAKVGSWHDHDAVGEQYGGRQNGRGPANEWPATQTLGWRATCSCDAGEAVPATVLDPFMGTGTTLLAAQRLGRASIGIDLNARYCAVAWARLRADVETPHPSPPANGAPPQAEPELPRP